MERERRSGGEGDRGAGSLPGQEFDEGVGGGGPISDATSTPLPDDLLDSADDDSADDDSADDDSDDDDSDENSDGP